MLSLSYNDTDRTTAEHHYHVKLSESQYQEQDSSSSTGQSHHEVATSARNNFHMQKVMFQPGNNGIPPEHDTLCFSISNQRDA